jgi:MFS family permease
MNLLKAAREVSRLGAFPETPRSIGELPGVGPSTAAAIAVFAFGWSLMVPVVTLMVLDQVPDRRGMASSVQSFVSALANAAVAGLISPWVMHSALGLALASGSMLLIGLLAGGHCNPVHASAQLGPSRSLRAVWAGHHHH